MSSRAPKLIATIVFFLLFLALFLYLTFPTEALKKRVESEIDNNTGFHAKIDSISFSPFLKLKINGLSLDKRAKDISIKIDELNIKPSVLSLLLNNKNVPFEAKIGDGKVDGNVVFGPDSNSLNSVRAELNNVHTDLITSFTKSGNDSPEFEGNIDGVVNVDFGQRNAQDVSGSFNFTSDNMSISKLTFEGFTLPSYKNLLVNLNGKIEKKKTVIDELSFENKDFDLMMVGSMPLIWEIKKGGKLDLMLNLNIKSDEAKSGLLQAFMKKETDGSLSAKIAGTTSKPKFVKSEKL